MKGAFSFSKNHRKNDTFYEKHAILKEKRRFFNFDALYDVKKVRNVFITSVAL
jgi:hypothetical protein